MATKDVSSYFVAHTDNPNTTIIAKQVGNIIILYVAVPDTSGSAEGKRILTVDNVKYQPLTLDPIYILGKGANVCHAKFISAGNALQIWALQSGLSGILRGVIVYAMHG